MAKSSSQAGSALRLPNESQILSRAASGKSYTFTAILTFGLESQ